MRRLCRSVSEVALLAALAWGCGSNAGDSLVLRFVRFDNTGLTQADSVGENSADVDVMGGLCEASPGGPTSAELFTQTVINAVFINEEAADINLERYRIFLPTIGGVDTQLGEFIEYTIGRNVRGGRCSNNADQHCAQDTDCSVLGVTGTCTHSETTIADLLLFDFTTKQLLDRPQFFGTATNVTIQFFGTDDANQSFNVSANYVVTFDDFNNCPAGFIEVPVS